MVFEFTWFSPPAVFHSQLVWHASAKWGREKVLVGVEIVRDVDVSQAIPQMMKDSHCEEGGK